MAGHELIDAYLTGLARRLPADTVDELADGLLETWQRYLAGGLAPAAAARAAIAEFGAAQSIADEFVAGAPGRRVARLLLATGPVMAVCWGATLVTNRVWTWPIPPPAATAYAATLLTVVALLGFAATSRHSYRRTRLAAPGALALLALDATMIIAVAALAPVAAWPTALAVAASLARIGVTVRSLPRTLAG